MANNFLKERHNYFIVKDDLQDCYWIMYKNKKRPIGATLNRDKAISIIINHMREKKETWF